MPSLPPNTCMDAHRAALAGDEAALTAALASPDSQPGRFWAPSPDEGGKDALQCAVHGGHVGCVYALLKDPRTDPLATCLCEGWTALHYAASDAAVDPKITELILGWCEERGYDLSDLDMTDHEGMNPLDVADEQENPACAALLEAAGMRRTYGSDDEEC